MSFSTDVAGQFLKYFELQDTVADGYEAIENYYRDPSPATLGKIFGFVGTQAAGQIAGNIIDKFMPTAGERIVWESMHNQFDNPRGFEDEKSKTDLKKKAIGFVIGLALERLLDDVNSALGMV